MKKKLYYVVIERLEKIDDNDIISETTGIRDMTVYDIAMNIPRIFCELECLQNEDYPKGFLTDEEEIQNYLDDNGYGDTEFEFIKL